MSVCTGAFVLAKTGLLDGKSATTYHGAFGRFAMMFPNIELKRGARFVENGNLATAGGLSSGIDLALRVVERYYGRDVAQKTAYNMEYQGQGWMNPDSNSAYATALVSTAEHPLCTVCGMDVDPKIAPKSVFKGPTTISARKTIRKRSTPPRSLCHRRAHRQYSPQLKSNRTTAAGLLTRRIVFVAAPGTEILDLVGPLQVFARASDMYCRENPGAPIYSVEVVSISSQSAR